MSKREPGEPPRPAPDEEPPPSSAERESRWVADHTNETRDIRPALGTRGEPGSWRRAVDGAGVPLARPDFGDAQWSYLFKADTTYADAEPDPGEVAAANLRGRLAPMPATVQGPIIKPPVWTWEVPLYFWLGGVAAGSSFVGLACDLAGDERSAVTARMVSLAAVLPAPLLLIADLGRPGRFLNMLRIFKPRSPMNLGAWCLAGFSTVGAGSVAADLAGFRRTGRALGGLNALLGGYLGSYTGVLLASTAVPVWARSRLFLGPIFVATATATGAAATRLTLVARGLPHGHPTRIALARLEASAIAAELALSALNERRLGRAGRALKDDRPGALFRLAKGSVLAGLALRFAGNRLDRRLHHVASALYLGGGLGFRYAWVQAGRHSANDHEAVARIARGHVTEEDERLPRRPTHRELSELRPPRRPLVGAGRLWTEGMRRASLLVEKAARR